MEIVNNLKTIIRHRSLITRMTYKEMTDRYAGSSLGIVWAILQPLLLILLYALVFTFIFKVRIDNGSTADYALFAIAGLVPWISTSEGVSKSVPAVFSKAPLVKQAIFPTEILPISATMPSIISLSIGLFIYLIMTIFISPERLTWLLVFVPLIILIQAIFIVGIGYFLAIAGVYFRDLTEIITLVLTILMFTTPILYTDSSIPQNLRPIINLNPLAHLIYIYRDLLYTGQIEHPWSFLIFPLITIGIFVLGNHSFNKIKHLFANFL